MIKRHYISQAHIEDIQNNLVRKYKVLNRIKEKELTAYLINSLVSVYHQLAALELYLNNDTKLCVGFLQKSAQAGDALYTLALNVGKQVNLKLDDFEEATQGFRS